MIGDGDENGIYVNTDMHVYVYVCVRDDSRGLEGGRVFDRVYFLGRLKNCPPIFVSFFQERAYSI